MAVEFLHALSPHFKRGFPRRALGYVPALCHHVCDCPPYARGAPSEPVGVFPPRTGLLRCNTVEHFNFEMLYQGCASSLAPRSRKLNFVELLSGEVGVPYDFEIAQSQS